jgi:hypothetical protein
VNPRQGLVTVAVLSSLFVLTSCTPGPVEEASGTTSPSPSPSPSPVETVGGRFGSKHRPKPRPTPPSVVTPQPIPSTLTGTWLGVLRTSRNPNRFDDELKDLRKRYDGRIIVGQVFCFPGVNEGRSLPDDGYILAFITGSLPAAQALVADSGYSAHFYARVEDRCGG